MYQHREKTLLNEKGVSDEKERVSGESWSKKRREESIILNFDICHQEGYNPYKNEKKLLIINYLNIC